MPRRDPSAAPSLVLASGSPRRRQLLGEAGIRFEITPSSIVERPRPGEPPPDLAARLAQEKANDVARRLPAEPARPVLGADTIVVTDRDRVLGKPRDRADAVSLLEQLVGRRHRVMTAIALAWSDDRPLASEVITSEVEMRDADRAQLEAYVSLGESDDKAGAYALQGEGGRRFVVAVRGSRSNVIGLPLDETLAMLERAGAIEAPGREPSR